MGGLLGSNGPSQAGLDAASAFGQTMADQLGDVQQDTPHIATPTLDTSAMAQQARAALGPDDVATPGTPRSPVTASDLPAPDVQAPQVQAPQIATPDQAAAQPAAVDTTTDTNPQDSATTAYGTSGQGSVDQGQYGVGNYQAPTGGLLGSAEGSGFKSGGDDGVGDATGSASATGSSDGLSAKAEGSVATGGDVTGEGSAVAGDQANSDAGLSTPTDQPLGKRRRKLPPRSPV